MWSCKLSSAAFLLERSIKISNLHFTNEWALPCLKIMLPINSLFTNPIDLINIKYIFNVSVKQQTFMV